MLHTWCRTLLARCACDCKAVDEGIMMSIRRLTRWFLVPTRYSKHLVSQITAHVVWVNIRCLRRGAHGSRLSTWTAKPGKCLTSCTFNRRSSQMIMIGKRSLLSADSEMRSMQSSWVGGVPNRFLRLHHTTAAKYHVKCINLQLRLVVDVLPFGQGTRIQGSWWQVLHSVISGARCIIVHPQGPVYVAWS